MSHNPRRRTPRRASEHRVGLRRNGMPPIGGDGADMNSELTLMALRSVAREVETLTRDERLEAVISSLNALLAVCEIIAPQHREIVEYMRDHDATGAHDERMLARIEGFIGWIGQLEATEIVSLVATSASLLDLIRCAGFDAPDQVLELFADDDQPDARPGE